MGSFLAVVNVAQLRHPLADGRMAELVAAVDPINRLADASPGFVWRCRGAAGHSALLERGSGDLIVNVSVWESYLDFHRFTYQGAHGRYLTARARWFVHLPGPTTALWWTSPDERPGVEPALVRLRILRAEGPTRRSFTVLRQWDPSGRPIRPRHPDQGSRVERP